MSDCLLTFEADILTDQTIQTQPLIPRSLNPYPSVGVDFPADEGVGGIYVMPAENISVISEDTYSQDQ